MDTSKKILVIDDEIELSDVLSEKLKREGFHTFVAHDGEEGLALALAEKPDLIMLDIIMPKMDGLAMLKKLREDKWGKTARVILLTVLDNSESLSQAMEYGVYEYFVKTDQGIDDVVKRVKEKIGI